LDTNSAAAKSTTSRTTASEHRTSSKPCCRWLRLPAEHILCSVVWFQKTFQAGVLAQSNIHYIDKSILAWALSPGLLELCT
jgi:hypothetical protein